MRIKKYHSMARPLADSDDANHYGHRFDGSGDSFLSHGSRWTRVRQGDKYGYVRTNGEGRPVDFNENTGYFTVYDKPDTSSHHFQSYKLPDNGSQYVGIPFAPIYEGGTLDNVDIYPSTPPVGIVRTPDDHNAALARDRAVDEYVNGTTPDAADIFGTTTWGLVPNPFQVSKDFYNGKPVEGVRDAAFMLVPWNNGAAVVAGGIGLADENGVRKTYNLLSDRQYGKAALSGAGDVLNGAMAFAGGKPVVTSGIDLAHNWRPWVPNNADRYYRIVGETGDPIGDAIDSGVIRGPGMNPNLDDALFARQGRFDIGKTYTYPMFSKGSPWKGGTARASDDFKERPIIIRSKKNTGPIVWEESNKDFRHKGHAGIFRPSYYGDVNASPTQFFEYWEPRRFGYMRRSFPESDNPWATFLGNGYNVDRGEWESSLGIDGKRFGDYIGSGSEQTVFNDASNPNTVLKVANEDFNEKELPGLKEGVERFVSSRNSVPLQEPINFSGIVDIKGQPYPVFSQRKLKPLGEISSAEFNRTYTPLIRDALRHYGYTGDGVNSNFSNGYRTLIDIKPDNVGFDMDGNLRFFDVDYIREQ